MQLYKADFNTMLKYLLGQRLMWYSEEHGINGHQLFGSRKDKYTYDALVTIRVIYDFARAQRDYLISISNDLKGLYDRVRPTLTTVTTSSIGLPKKVAVCHAKALR